MHVSPEQPIYLEICERHTVLRVVCLAKEEVPEPLRLCLLFKVLDNGEDRLPALRTWRELRGSNGLCRLNLILCSTSHIHTIRVRQPE
jgi:hypothetical protein